MHNVAPFIDWQSGPVSVKVVPLLLKTRGMACRTSATGLAAAPRGARTPSVIASPRPCPLRGRAVQFVSHPPEPPGPSQSLRASDDRCSPPFHLVFLLFPVSSPFLEEQQRCTVAHGSVTLVGSRCAGLQYAHPLQLCSRAGILAPSGCPWDNWHRTSCYWPLFWCNADCCEAFPCGKDGYVLSLCLLNLGCVMWLVILFLAGCHANSISEAAVPV